MAIDAVRGEGRTWKERAGRYRLAVNSFGRKSGKLIGEVPWRRSTTLGRWALSADGKAFFLTANGRGRMCPSLIRYAHRDWQLGDDVGHGPWA